MAMGPMGHGPHWPWAYMGKVWVYAGCNDSQWVFEFAQNGGGPPCKLFITFYNCEYSIYSWGILAYKPRQL